MAVTRRPASHPRACPNRRVCALSSVVAALYFVLIPQHADAFWLLGFATADTVPAGDFSAIAGTGGQYSSTGNSSTASSAQSSFTPFLAHAGVRTGLADGWDVGYRLATVPLPFSSVGPTLGGEIDVKHRLTPMDSTWQAAVVLGMAYAYLDLSGQSRSAWSPGVDFVLSRTLSARYAAISELRYVYTALPTATGGVRANSVSATGVDFGMRINLTKTVSLAPELGVFNFAGRLADHGANGFAVQYGAILAFRF